jgi:hypothetical protein
MVTQAAVLGLFAHASARIVDSGLWDNNDWYDEDVKIGVANGVPYSNDEAVSRRLDAAMATEGSVLDYMDFPNV